MATHYSERPQGNTPIKNCVVDDFNQRIVTPFVTKDKFIITVDSSDTSGGTTTYPTSNADQFILPAFGTGYTIEWYKKDNFQIRGSLEGNDETTITFPEPGVYIVIVSGGTFNRIRHSDGNNNTSASTYKDHKKILELNQWGDTQWSSLVSMFRDCRNFKMPAKDVPDLSGTTDIAGCFRGCSVFGAVNEPSALGSWDVSTITRMSDGAGLGLFGECDAFNQNINDWDVSNNRDMGDMFRSATSFNQPLDQWDVSNVSSFFRAFENTPFNQNINSWDVSGATSMFAMFQRSSFNQPLDQWDVSGVVTMGSGSIGGGLFNGMFKNSAFNQDVSMWDTSSLVSASTIFNNSVFNQDIGQWNTQNLRIITVLSDAFNYSLENWDLSSMLDMRALFNRTSITTENLSRTLIGWANFVYANSGPYNIPLGANNKTIHSTVYNDIPGQFSDAVSAKNYLVDSTTNGGAGWTITGATPV